MAITHAPQIKRILSRRGPRKTFPSPAPREPVETHEIHEQAEETRVSVPMSGWRYEASDHCIVLVAPACCSGKRVGGRVTVRALLRCEALSATTAHPAVSPQVGDLERGHLPRDLPHLAGKKNDSPYELKGHPERDSKQERVELCRCTNHFREETRNGLVRHRRGKLFCEVGECEVVEEDNPEDKSGNEYDELAVVVHTYAVPYPRAVVVKSCNAAVADSAVFRSEGFSRHA